MLRSRLMIYVALALLLAACGGSSDEAGETGQSSSATRTSGARTITGLPNPCDWLSAEEAQQLLGLSETPPQTAMGDAASSGRSCVYTNAEQTTWINVGYQGLNPQVFSAQGKSEQELVELATSLYAHGFEQVYSGKTEGYPTLAFGDAERTIMVVFTDIGKKSDLPEGVSERLLISSYYNVILHMFAPDQSGEQRLATINGLVERPVKQLGDVSR